MAAKEPSFRELRNIILILEALPQVKKKIESKSRLIASMARGGMYEQYMALKCIDNLREYIEEHSCFSARDKEVLKYFYL